MENKETNTFDANILNFDDDVNTDIRIKPNYYIHMGILMAQRTLMFSVAKTSVGEGLLAYSVFIEHIEVICRAANYLSDDYETELNNFKNNDEYKKIERQDVKMAKLANKKLELIMKSVFKGSPVDFPMKL